MIHNSLVEIVERYTYRGTIFDSKLRFSFNTKGILQKYYERMYPLWKLNSADIPLLIHQQCFSSTPSLYCCHNVVNVFSKIIVPCMSCRIALWLVLFLMTLLTLCFQLFSSCHLIASSAAWPVRPRERAWPSLTKAIPVLKSKGFK